MRKGKRASEANRITELIQDAVDKGATTAEDVHKSIAGLPLKVLEEVKFLKQPVKEVRRVQDRSIGAVYDLVRGINKQVGTLASELLAEAGTRASVVAGKAPKPRSTAGHTARP